MRLCRSCTWRTGKFYILLAILADGFFILYSLNPEPCDLLINSEHLAELLICKVSIRGKVIVADKQTGCEVGRFFLKPVHGEERVLSHKVCAFLGMENRVSEFVSADQRAVAAG